MKNAMIKDYVEIFELENTSIIYDGIKRLWEQLLLGKNRNREEIAIQISQIYEECCKGRKFLAQNLMSEVFRFLDYSPQHRLREKEAEALGGMVLLYDKVMEMEQNHDQMGIQKTYSEDYSEICDYLSMIAMKMDSYLVYVRDSGNIILASSTKEYDETTEEFIYTLEKGNQDRMVPYGDTVTFLPAEKDEKTKILIKLLLSRRKDVEYKQTVYIVFAGNKEISREQCMKSSRNVLFLRQQLQILLERDLYALRHFKISYEDVKPIQDNGQYNILHVSDLHVDAVNCEDIKQLISQTEFGVQDVTKDETPKIDLIVITGDVAQGKATAMDMEVNYKKAEEVIRCLAQKIWSDPKNPKSLRYDWKKRVIIIPGNHDYASMNELLVVHKDRATFNGEPAREEGSPMIKYTYYIDFLRRLLDLDISDIVNQNLNDYRVYPNYELELVCFNTIAEVSMLRNNKVQIDEEFLSGLPDENQKDFFRIYLMHHTPLYVENDMDYNKDKYGYKDVEERLYNFLKHLEECYWTKTIEENEWDAIRKQLVNISENGKKTGIYRDVEYLYNHRKDMTDERCYQIVNEYRKNVDMCEKDKEIYEERLEAYMNHIKPDIIMGGHTHQKRVDEYKKKGEKEGVLCCEAGKFYESTITKHLNYGILTIDTRKERTQRGTYRSYDSRDIYAGDLEKIL